MRKVGFISIRPPRKPWSKRISLKERAYFAVRKMVDNMAAECVKKDSIIAELGVRIAARRLRIVELQSEIASLKRQNKELKAELAVKDSIIKKQIVMMEEAKPRDAEYIKAGNLYYCSNCKADFQHYELYGKYCPECGSHFTNWRKGE